MEASGGVELPAVPDAAAREFGKALGLSATLAGFLQRQGHVELGAVQRFLNPKLSELTHPEGMADRQIATERLAAAIHNRHPICVFGDYDCDGMTATVILTEILRAFGGKVEPVLASRFDGGYGLSHGAAKRVLATGARLLVTCDCGSSDHEVIAELGRQGVDTIVIDHHLVPEQKLPALAFLNPHRPDCAFEYKHLASCGLVLSVGAALRAALGHKLDLRDWLDLVAIGTIADVAPLDGDNRVLVRAGLKSLAEGKRPGVRALLDLTRLNGLPMLSAHDVAFRLAPRLNAPGRLGAPDLAVQLLLAPDLEQARALAARVEQCSAERRRVQDQMIDEATAEIERAGYAERPAIVIGREGWNHGIVGIVAGRLVAKFDRPVAVIGFTAGVGRGSVRGPAQARLHDALSQSKEPLVRFGGHQAAAGLEILADKLGDFRHLFEQAVAQLQGEKQPQGPPLGALVRFAPGDDPFKLVCELDLLEPCGLNNPAPEVVVEAHVRSARAVQGNHLKLDLTIPDSGNISAFGVNLGHYAASPPQSLVVSGKLRRDMWRGGRAVELNIERIW